MSKSIAVLLSLAVLCVPAVAQEKKSDQSETTITKKDDSTSTQKAANKADHEAADKPENKPGWIIVEEDFWFPFRLSFIDAVHNARVHYRHGREKAARDEINSAIMWLKIVKGHAANKVTEEDLGIAIDDLEELVMFLERGDLVKASLMEKTFARAATALAKHHKFAAHTAIAKNDMKLASKHLLAAAHDIQQAARSANHEYGTSIVEIIDDYPFGVYDDTVIIDRSRVERELDAIDREIRALAGKTKKVSK